MVLLTGNDIQPRTVLQTAVCGMGTFMGALINANIFGELAVLITTL